MSDGKGMPFVGLPPKALRMVADMLGMMAQRQPVVLLPLPQGGPTPAHPVRRPAGVPAGDARRMGAGAWAATPPARRPAIVAAIANVGGWGRALFGEPASRADLATIDVPVLLMTGSTSPTARRHVARRRHAAGN